MTKTIRFLAILALTLWAGLSAAQGRGTDQIDVSDWEALSSRAEAALDAGRASDQALEDLRSEIANYRTRFGEARDENAARIRTLQSQLDALGPEPENGEESETIAASRAALEQRLEELRAPQVVAEAAFTRANGLVSEIDAMLRARQTEALFMRGPVPVNPALWSDALRELNDFLRSVGNEVERALDNQVRVSRAISAIPLAAFFTIFGLLCVTRGRQLAGRLGEYLRNFGGKGSGVWSFVVSLGRIFIPLLGIYLLTRAAQVTEVTGMRGTAILNAIPYWAAILLGFAWLGERLLEGRAARGLTEAPTQRVQFRSLLWLLSTMIVLRDAVNLIIDLETIDDASAAVMHFPIILMTGIFLFRFITVARPETLAAQPIVPPEEAEDEAEPRAAGILFRMMPPLRTAAQIIAIGAPLAAAAGYQNAADASIFPMIWTLAIIALAAVFQRFFAGVYGWATGQGNAALDSLFSALIGFVLAAVCIPFIALIWGVREADLGELWSRFLEGITVGGAQISPVDFLTFLLIFAIGYGVTRLLQGALKTSLLPKTRIDAGGQNAIVSGTGYVGIFLAGLAAVTGAGINLSSLAIVAGALSVGIGFGLQTIVSNFVSGIILLIERPVSEGDWIEVAGTMGIVKDISVRATRIETFDRTDVIVPNSDLISGAVTNYTRTPVGRVIVPVGVAYGTDTRKVERILLEIAEEHPMVLARPAPFVVFQGFGADSLDFEVRAIIREVGFGLTVKTEINHAIAERFVQEGIEIPFAQRDVWLRNPEALGTPPEPETGSQPPVAELDDGPDADGGLPDDGPSTTTA